MFAYCGNNPVVNSDASGCGWEYINGKMIYRITGSEARAAELGSAVTSIIPDPIQLSTLEILECKLLTGTLSGVSRSEYFSRPAVNVQYEAEHTKNARNSTKQTHENGQARKKRDHGGEKGDARRTNRSNKRKPSTDCLPATIPTIPSPPSFDEIVKMAVPSVVIIGAGLVIIVLVIDDLTGGGSVDNALIPPIAYAIWDTARKVTA